jgi:hypothetical protein
MRHRKSSNEWVMSYDVFKQLPIDNVLNTIRGVKAYR